MTDQEVEQYFQYHNENIKLLKIGFDNIRNQIKDLYKSKDKNDNYIFTLSNFDSNKINTRKIEKSFSRILSGIQVSWAEESIKRLLYERNLFSDRQRDYLIKRPALDQKWYETLKIVFSIAYDLVPVGDEICSTVRIDRERRNLGNELVDQYLELRRIITDHLVPNFSIRNKVQHGEWEYAFKPKYSAEFSHDITDMLNGENIVTTTSRYTLVNSIYQMIVDMGRFKSNRFALDSMLTPFEYFYPKYIKKISYEVVKIGNSEIEKFINEIIEREKRGENYRHE
ncbi:hypothetical protein [Anaerophaga thermohalophila]|uniref:hypothetical protein n=1 Tax=Anaerophaga thermohalophila TaxID=177400 RepID=UPI0002DF8468|nr:hypothetical protein [Anaerophaga thermohalophila]